MTRGLALALALTTSLATAPGTQAETNSPSAPGRTAIARMLAATAVRVRPTPQSPLVRVVPPLSALTRQQTALPILAQVTDPNGRTWLRVRLPGRPNGSTGWIPAERTRLSSTRWRLVIDLSARTATLWRDGRPAERFRVVVGKSSTPTPRGDYFLVEHVRQTAGSRLGPWALATSAYSHVLQEFDGGPGQIALHGRDGELARDPLGSAASHGCIRFDDSVIEHLAALLPNGTPIVIQ